MTAPDFSVAEILAWARTKPADEQYCYADPNNCALCQFLRETGRAENPGVMPHVEGFPEYGYWDDATSKRHPYPAAIEPALECKGARSWTFGALVERLEALASDAPVPPSEWTRLDAYMADIETVSALTRPPASTAPHHPGSTIMTEQK